MELSEIVDHYGTPAPQLVSKLDKGNGVSLDYVGHADVTKMLIAIDPMWTWEPAAWIDGKPAINVHEATLTYRNGETKKTRIATMWGYMSVLGKSLPCVGSAPADKEEVEKELIGDLIRNGALRFGICINLWSKSDSPAPSYTKPAYKPDGTGFGERPSQQYEKREATTGGAVRIRGNQHGELPDWLAGAAAEQGITEVYDNRDSLAENPKRPWFKCTASKVGLWPPKGTPAPASVVQEPVWASDEEPF